MYKVNFRADGWSVFPVDLPLTKPINFRRWIELKLNSLDETPTDGYTQSDLSFNVTK